MYLLQCHAPDAVLPASVGAMGGQALAAAVEQVAGHGAGQWRRRLHLHGRHVQQPVAQARPVVGGVEAHDAPRLA